METKYCLFEGEEYPQGEELCTQNECMTCDDGEWEASEFEVGYRY